MNTVLKVSALIAPSSGRTLSYAQKYNYIFTLNGKLEANWCSTSKINNQL